jgi:phospholipid/cholesterol/gamma-HCH transport system ATP-binding protein
MTNTRLTLKNVHKSFGTKKVLQGITLDVHEGESLVVIGGSGTGKSVMLKCILGLLPADTGSIILDGQELVKSSESVLEAARQKISMLFQGSALFDSLPVWENVAFGLLQEKHVNRQEGKALAIKKLAAVGMPKEVADLYPAELSGGMQRRVALARAIASDPKMIFFDEPTTGLDPIMAGVINDLIRTSVRELGATAITITHDMASARRIADRVAMIYQGQIIWQGPIKDIEHSNNPYIEQFIHGRTEGPIQIDVS